MFDQKTAIPWIFMLILFSIKFHLTSAECNKCDATTKTACITANTFQICNDLNEPNPGVYTCSGQRLCDSTNVLRCITTATPTCTNKCGVCNMDSSNAACRTDKTFSFCFAAGELDDTIYTCPTNHICNSNNRDICVMKTSTTVSTCPASPVPTPIDPKAFCMEKQTVGRFPVPGNCKSYINCYRWLGQWAGIRLPCILNTCFNKNTQLCELCNSATVC